jgi:glutamyl/glutaminyl-tRNA synthetase
MQRIVTRLAPTPSGFLHAGNIYNFLLNWLWAKALGGQVLLRIDDADAARKRPEYVEDIFRVLDWLGLHWDLGPSGPDDFEKEWSQHKRQALYTTILDELVEKGLVFACACSRKQLGNEAPYPGTCTNKGLPLDLPDTAWRIQMDKETTTHFTDSTLGTVHIPIAQTTGSFVVRKKDAMAAYQLTSLADDQHFGVTHIARGQDLLPSTAMQLYLDGLLDKKYLNACFFWHHPLLQQQDGAKISKSAGHQAHSLLQTTSKEKLLADFAAWMNWPQAIGLQEMVAWIKAQLPPTDSH